MMSIKFDTKWVMNSIEKQMQNIVKNHDLEITCPKCGSSLWKHTLKELNIDNKLYCETCKKTVEVNLDKVDKKFK